MREASVGQRGSSGHTALMRRIVLWAIPLAATMWVVLAAGCAVKITTGAPAGGPPQVPHALAGREGQCLLCHETGVAGAPKAPDSHQGRTNDICHLCHIQAPSVADAQTGGHTAAGTPAPAKTATRTAASLPTSVPTHAPGETALPGQSPADSVPASPAEVSFVRDVLPILQSSCAACHGAGMALGNVNVSSYQAMMAARPKGPVVIPGDPENSLLAPVLHGKPMQMPPGSAMADAKIQTVEKWIKDGALDN